MRLTGSAEKLCEDGVQVGILHGVIVASRCGRSGGHARRWQLRPREHEWHRVG